MINVREKVSICSRFFISSFLKYKIYVVCNYDLFKYNFSKLYTIFYYALLLRWFILFTPYCVLYIVCKCTITYFFSQFCVPDLVFYSFPNPVLFSPVRMLWILEEPIAVSGPRISSKTLISMQGSRGWSMWCGFHKNDYCASAFFSFFNLSYVINNPVNNTWSMDKYAGRHFCIFWSSIFFVCFKISMWSEWFTYMFSYSYLEYHCQFNVRQV